MDVLVVPSIPTCYTRRQIEEEERMGNISANSNLGTYTNFVNLMNLVAIALPNGGMRQNRIPFSVTLIAPRGRELALLRIAKRLLRRKISLCLINMMPRQDVILNPTTYRNVPKKFSMRDRELTKVRDI